MCSTNWSLSDPQCLRYTAHRLWKQGLRSGDAAIIHLCYGYSDDDTSLICSRLAQMEAIAEARLNDYNPDLGF